MSCCGMDDGWSTDFEVDSFAPTYDDSAYDTSYEVQQAEPVSYDTASDGTYGSEAYGGDTSETQWISTDGGEYSTDNFTMVTPDVSADAGSGAMWVSADGGDYPLQATDYGTSDLDALYNQVEADLNSDQPLGADYTAATAGPLLDDLYNHVEAELASGTTYAGGATPIITDPRVFSGLNAPTIVSLSNDITADSNGNLHGEFGSSFDWSDLS